MGLALTSVLTLALATWSQPSSDEVLDGVATYYSPGLMETVARNRGLLAEDEDLDAWLAAEGLVGLVALNRAGDLRRRVWITGPRGIEGPFLSVDCAQRDHYLDRETARRIVEVDYATAERWGMAGVGPLDVRVYFSIGNERRNFQPR